jgi:hypothetical protein
MGLHVDHIMSEGRFKFIDHDLSSAQSYSQWSEERCNSRIPICCFAGDQWATLA